MSKIVSIDLGIRPESNGICLVSGNEVTFPALSVPLAATLVEYLRHWQTGGDQEATVAAQRYAEYLVGLDPNYIVIDAPQGCGRRGFSRRRAEAILRTR